MTSLLRELVPLPMPSVASTTIVSRPASASARAHARPTTPAPTTTASTRSIAWTSSDRLLERLHRLPRRRLQMRGDVGRQPRRVRVADRRDAEDGREDGARGEVRAGKRRMALVGDVEVDVGARGERAGERVAGGDDLRVVRRAGLEIRS